MSVKIYETAEDFCEDADWPTFAVRDAEYRWWLAWSTEDGDWYASSPPHEDDPLPEGDPYRPVGPVALESLALPWMTVALDDLESTDSGVQV